MAIQGFLKVEGKVLYYVCQKLSCHRVGAFPATAAISPIVGRLLTSCAQAQVPVGKCTLPGNDNAGVAIATPPKTKSGGNDKFKGWLSSKNCA